MQHLEPLRRNFAAPRASSREISSWPTETRDKTELHGVGADGEDNRNSRSRRLGGEGRDRSGCDDHSHPMLDQLSRHRLQSIELVPRPSVLDCHGLALDADPSHKLVREVVARAVSDPAAVIKGLGEPKRAEVQKLYHSDTLTILNLIWAPKITV